MSTQVETRWVSAEALAKCAAEVWASFCENGDGERRPRACGTMARQSVIATTSISGAWEGEIAIVCPRRLALQAAVNVFGHDPDDVPGDDVRDLMGEIVNQIAGNLKMSLPQPSALGLPVVTSGENLRIAFPRGEVVAETTITVADAAVAVLVAERTE